MSDQDKLYVAVGTVVVKLTATNEGEAMEKLRSTSDWESWDFESVDLREEK